MIRNKESYKNCCKKAMATLLATSMLFGQSVYAIEAINVNQESRATLSNEQLASLVNPILQSYEADNSGTLWSINESARLVISAESENVNNERLSEVVKLVNAELLEKGLVSNPLSMVYGIEDEVTSNDILINIDDVTNITDMSTSPETYKIEINENGISLVGATENAVLHGLRTIEKLMITNNGLVHGTIIDFPDIAERRLHVDCGRKYLSKDWFIRQIREMSYMNMNAIQMHFSENMGFRIECETDPAIVSDEYLTKVEVREIIEEARKYGVKVIPSFDTPGHVDQILKVHPEYGQISNKGTHFRSGLDITNPEVVEYFKSLYREYMELFEGCTDFHIGGDEYMEFDRAPFTTEYKSVLNDYAKEKLGPDYIWKDALADYINEIAELVHEGGFKPRIWNDGIYYGEKSYYDKPQSVVMKDYLGIDFWSQMGWNRDVANLNTFIQKGHQDIYNVNAGFFYYVLRNSKPTDGREQHSFDYLNQDRRIFDSWTPGKFESNTVDDNSSFIKGASMAIWCDNPNLVDEDVITEDISKELRSLATKSWNTESNSITTLEGFRDTYQELGNVAGFEKGSELPGVGDILPSEDVGKVTLKFVSDTGKVLKDDVIKYGIVGNDYSFNADDIYGYRLVSDSTFTGVYDKEEAEYTFVYELHCDKTQLENEIRSELQEVNYIRETFSTYKSEFIKAREVYNAEDSEQLQVDEALEALLQAKSSVVPLEYYPLYVETEYTINGDGYASGYEEYLAAVENGKAVLYGEDVTLDAVKVAFDSIKEAKANLMKRDGNVPTITATDKTYTHSGGAWEGPYFPPEKYAVERIVDGDVKTKAWFAGNQNIGDEIVFTFAQPLNMSEIRLVYPSDVGADIIAKADVEVATTLGEWTKVGELTTADTTEKTITFDKTSVKYVRIVLKENVNKWYQIAEMYFTYDQPQESNELRELIEEAEELDITNKNLNIVSNMVDALIEGQKAYVENATDTEAVTESLRAAIDELVNSSNEDVYKEHLEIAVEEAKNITEDELSNVVPAVVSEFRAALEEAEGLLANVNATQEEVNLSFERLSKVMQMLSFEKGDKKALTSLIDRINGLDKEEYIASTWDKLEEELEKANGVLNDENALEAEVSKTYKDLMRGFLELRLKPSKDKLEDLINKAEGLDSSKYTAKSYQAVEKALSRARAVFSDETAESKDIEKVEKALEVALNSLVEKSDDNSNTASGEGSGNDNNGGNSGSGNNNGSGSNGGETQNTGTTNGKLPNTGGTPAAAVGILGAITSMLGATILRKKK